MAHVLAAYLSIAGLSSGGCPTRCLPSSGSMLADDAGLFVCVIAQSRERTAERSDVGWRLVPFCTAIAAANAHLTLSGSRVGCCSRAMQPDPKSIKVMMNHQAGSGTGHGTWLPYWFLHPHASPSKRGARVPDTDADTCMSCPTYFTSSIATHAPIHAPISPEAAAAKAG